ncbi:glycosyltransferase [Arenibacterium sp. CAU 1754]
MRIAFVVGPALGHVARSLSIARAVSGVSAQADIHFVSPTSRNAQKHVQPVFPLHQIEYDTPGGARFKQNLETTLRDLDPDIICLDMSPLPWLYQLRLDHPNIVYFTNFFLTAAADNFTDQERLFAEHSPSWNAERHASGLPDLVSAKEFYDIGHTVLCDPAGLIPPDMKLPKRYHIAGSCTWEPNAQADPELPREARFLIVALGSTGRKSPDKSAIEKVKQALRCTDTVVFSNKANGVDWGDVLQFDNAPISPFLRQSPLAVTQGGAGSTYLALNSGTPVSVYPTIRNQELMAEYTDRAGVGCDFDVLADMAPADIAARVAAMTSACDRFRAAHDAGPRRAAQYLVDLFAGSPARP